MNKQDRIERAARRAFRLANLERNPQWAITKAFDSAIDDFERAEVEMEEALQPYNR